MPVSLKAAAAVASKDLINSKLLAAVLLGTPSGGKSGALGTFGVKTLYAYFGAEKHGYVSALTHGNCELSPYPLSLDDNEKPLTPEQAIKRLMDVLTDKETLKAEGIKAVVVDGLTELEQQIMETQAWKSRIEIEKKGVTSYAGDVTLSMFRPIMEALRTLQRDLGVHYAVSCILDVQKYEDDGTILDGAPRLKGYDVAVGLLLQIPDRIMIGPMSDDNGDIEPRFQWTAKAHRSTADQKTKVVRKTFNFRPQLIGVDMKTFPAHTKADLSRLIKYKEAKKYVKNEG
jgi:hypothetical protein